MYIVVHMTVLSRLAKTNWMEGAFGQKRKSWKTWAKACSRQISKKSISVISLNNPKGRIFLARIFGSLKYSAYLCNKGTRVVPIRSGYSSNYNISESKLQPMAGHINRIAD